VTDPTARTAFDRRMLEALVCPLTHAPLSYDAAAGADLERRRIWPFRSATAFPVMLIDEARALD
jgi:uncharacterized protein YbaR (Trm112 family)